MTKHEPVVKLPPVGQVGIAVNDLESAIDYYSSNFGLGPFKVNDLTPDEVTYRGKEVKCHLRNAIARSGSLVIELVQPLEGESPVVDFLRERGEGIHHFGFYVDDLRGMLIKLAEAGITSIHQGTAGYASFAMLDADKVGGIQFELIELKKP